jgi:Family of unknown function (DUF5871)
MDNYINNTSSNFKMTSITLAKDFDFSKLSYNDPRMLDNGGKVVYVSYNKAPLIIQTPDMNAPFGMQKWSEDNRDDKYSLDLSFRGKDTRPSLQAFYDLLEGLDKKLVEDGFKNQQTWFRGRKYGNAEVLEALYTPLIRHPKDKNTGEITDKYPASFKIKVPTKDGKFMCEVFDEKRNAVDLNTINTKGAKVGAIIQFSGLWFAGGKFGSSWKVVQMKVTPSQSIRGFAFKEDPDDKVEDDLEDSHEPHDAKEIMEAAMGKSDVDASEVAANHDDIVSDSDDELEAKKVVVKRK